MNQKEINGQSCCPKCDSPDIRVSPTQSHTANIGIVQVSQDAYCNKCGHKFTYRTSYDNSKSFEFYNPNKKDDIKVDC